MTLVIARVRRNITEQCYESAIIAWKLLHGAVDLTDNTAFRHRIIAGPELGIVLKEFHDRNQHCGKQDKMHHHDGIPSI